MKLASSMKYLLWATTLAAVAGCSSAPMTREQKEHEALSKAYDTITSSRTAPVKK
jgi:hypothetical protein